MDKIRVDRTLHDYYEEVNMYHCPKGRRKFLRSKLIPHKRYIRWTQEMEEYMDDIGKAPRKAPRNLSGIKLARSVE